jgi:hypothetical protein
MRDEMSVSARGKLQFVLIIFLRDERERRRIKTLSFSGTFRGERGQDSAAQFFYFVSQNTN